MVVFLWTKDPDPGNPRIPELDTASKRTGNLYTMAEIISPYPFFSVYAFNGKAL